MHRPAGATTPAPGGKPQNPVRGWLVLAGMLAVAAVLLIAFPAQAQPSLAAFWRFGHMQHTSRALRGSITRLGRQA